eukprot:6366112-Pyramimonas_sp.AAC.1
MVLDRLYELIRHALAWAEYCPCHGHLLSAAAKTEDLIDANLLSRWKACPLRGMRLCELAAGDLFQHLRNLSQVAVTSLAA